MTPNLLTEVEQWCQAALAPRRPAGPLHLLNVRPTDAELAAHPASLNIQAYFAGARYAAGEQPPPFPRPLTDVEAESWRDGWAEHHADVVAAPAPLLLTAEVA